MQAKKRFGQNFLIDDNVINKIASSFNAKENDLIIEIGPGRGALTKELIKFNSFLIAFEIDTDMQIYLNKFENNKVKIIYNDILSSNFSDYINKSDYDNIYVVGNLPYYITTKIIEHLMKQNTSFSSLTFMVQKEVGNRFLASPCNKEYGYFTVLLNHYFNISKVTDVSKYCFVPVPKVESMVIKLIPKNKLSFDVEYSIFLKKCFQNKRKKLKNNINIDMVKKTLDKNGFNENVRAEEIQESIFYQMYLLINKTPN